MKKILAVLPCYNEQEDIGELVEKWMGISGLWREKGYELSVVCVDDKSTDATNAEIRRLCALYPGAVFLHEHEVNKGLGGVLLTAFRLFEKRCAGGDLLVVMDGDNTHDPVYSLDMLPLIEGGAGCVIASRYCRGSEIYGVSRLRQFMSWGARVYYSLALGVRNVRDYTCGYRMYAYEAIRSALDTYGDSLVERRSFACMMESLYKLSLVGVKFAEIPFELRYDNKKGESKMKVAKTARESLAAALKLRFSKGKWIEAQREAFSSK
jgi:dolichol-phosphate mannosyltransferase